MRVCHASGCTIFLLLLYNSNLSYAILKIIEIIGELNPDNLSASQIKHLTLRKAARAVVLDANNLIVLLFVEKLSKYELPGGGIEENEDIEHALRREVYEESGYRIRIMLPIGKIIQFSAKLNRQTDSYCFLAKTVDKQEQPQFTKKEKELGVKVTQVTLNQALKLTHDSSPRTYIALKKAKQLLDSITKNHLVENSKILGFRIGCY